MGVAIDLSPTSGCSVGEMASLQLVELRRDAKNIVVVNLHGKLTTSTTFRSTYHIIVAINTGATLQSWIHDGTEIIFVMNIPMHTKLSIDPCKTEFRGSISFSVHTSS